MNDMGQIIMRLRREKGLTQEQLANELGVSYQAVSKWENNNSCPDIALLPLLADLFGISIDILFGRTGLAVQEERDTQSELPWPNDDTFYAVLYHGHELIGSQAKKKDLCSEQQMFSFQYEGAAQNIRCAFDLMINGTVMGNISAGGDVSCDEVYGGVEADGDVSCDAVTGGVEAHGDVSCGNVGGAVNAGGDVSCDDVGGAVNACWDVSCDSVTGNVSAGGDVICEDIHGSAFAGGSFHSEDLDLEMEDVDK